MNEHSMTFKAYFSKVILAGTLAGILLLTGVCAFAQSSAAERNYNNAVDELEKAYAAIGLEKQRI